MMPQKLRLLIVPIESLSHLVGGTLCIYYKIIFAMAVSYYSAAVNTYIQNKTGLLQSEKVIRLESLHLSHLYYKYANIQLSND